MLQDITNRATQVTVQRDDGYDHFGRYVASLLRTIGLPQAVKLQQQITTMLTNAVCPSENLLSNDQDQWQKIATAANLLTFFLLLSMTITVS